MAVVEPTIFLIPSISIYLETIAMFGYTIFPTWNRLLG